MKVAILGNSITKHGYLEDVGWYAIYGMAASSKERDFAHLLMKKFNEIEPCEFLVDNISDFEFFFENPYLEINNANNEFNKDKLANKSFSVEKDFKSFIDFNADIVIIAIGENINSLSSDESKKHLHTELIHLFNALSNNGKGKVFVRSCFWYDKVCDKILKEACEEFGGIFVDISKETGKEEYLAKSGLRKFWHEGVANHPGDKGMKMIADYIWSAVEKEIL